MMNAFVMKKFSVLILSPLISTMCFFVGLQFYGLVYSFAFLGGGLLISVVIGILLLQNPFSMLVEGKGILVIDLTSTGIMQPFIVAVNNPYIQGKFRGKGVSDIFDREAVYNLATPIKNSTKADLKNGGVEIKLDEKKYNEARFALFHYPCLVWNSQIGSILTKDFLADQEKAAFAEHSILYLNRKIEELSGYIRDFGRHVVETLKPRENFLQSKWTWIIIVVVLVLLFILFLPSIIEIVGGGAAQTKQALTPAGDALGNVLTPR